jgi:CofD-related protein of GAK system
MEPCLHSFIQGILAPYTRRSRQLLPLIKQTRSGLGELITMGRLKSSSFSDSLERNSGDADDDGGTFSSIPAPFATVTRDVCIPDRVRVDRCHRLPEYGPKIVFFSGGTAIFDLSNCLRNYTHNSVHLITPFDSGGSSAEIRRAFDMLSVGDYRNRLLALSDKRESTRKNSRQIVELFSHRLDKAGNVAEEEFSSILTCQHPLIRAVKLPMRSILQNHLRWFASRMPEDFNLGGASIGNLIITGCFLEHDRDFVTAIFVLSKFLGVKGFCRPLTAANLHIRTLYSDGKEEVGQHLMNARKGGDGSDESCPTRKIVQIDLVENLLDDGSSSRQESQTCDIDMVSSDLIISADLICFPMGSFFASILANLLPKGVGKSIVARKCPKVYIPNAGVDPEMIGYTLAECVALLMKMIRDDCSGSTTGRAREFQDKDILNFVLMDTINCEYCIPVDKEAIEELGVAVIDVPLVDVDSDEDLLLAQPRQKSRILNATKVVEVLLTLAT